MTANAASLMWERTSAERSPSALGTKKAKRVPISPTGSKGAICARASATPDLAGHWSGACSSILRPRGSTFGGGSWKIEVFFKRRKKKKKEKWCPNSWKSLVLSCYSPVSLTISCYSPVSLTISCYSPVSLTISCYSPVSLTISCYSPVSLTISCYSPVIHIIML